jgi:NAD-dependent SIR2 family protein deacetylase
MQFVPNGPDIPNALLHAHEEGRVVFFCGAGISYPAGLPLFEGLSAICFRILLFASWDTESTILYCAT